MTKPVNVNQDQDFEKFIRDDKAVEQVLASLTGHTAQTDLDKAIYAPVLACIPGQLDQVVLALLDSGNVMQHEAISADLHKRLNLELYGTRIKAKTANSAPLAINSLSEPFKI
jgi:hypothetical protein